MEGDAEFQAKQDTIAFFRQVWPPADAQTLYDWGWTLLSDLGKMPAIRAVIAVYEHQGCRQNETEYDREARSAVEAWILEPTEAHRKRAGQLASVELDRYSNARTLANMAARTTLWRSAVGVCLTGNPYYLSDEKFHAICEVIRTELVDWASGKRDAVAERMGR
jgi:hypothetical protein